MDQWGTGAGAGWNPRPVIGTTAPNLSLHEIASNDAKQRGIAADADYFPRQSSGPMRLLPWKNGKSGRECCDNPPDHREKQGYPGD